MRRIACLNTVLLTLAVLFQSISLQAQIAGDVSGDNIVDASDYMMLKYIAIGRKKETHTSDINNDGKVNVQDLLILENYIYKNGPDPPARHVPAPKYPVQLIPGIVDLDKKTMEILISSEEEIGAFQFEIQGIGEIVEIIGGRAQDKEFTILSEGTRVLGVINKGRPILSGESMLLKIKFSTTKFEQACVFEPVVLTPASSPFQVQLGECINESATAKGLDELSTALVSGEKLNPKSDLNHDGYVDINDLILLENFLFRDGPPPPGSKSELNKKVKLSIQSVDLEAKRIQIRAHYSRPISGLQMRFSGINTITEIASAKFENNGFSVEHEKNNVMAHIGEGIPLLPDKGVLFEVSYDKAIGPELCIGNPIISNPEGSPYIIVLGECVSLVKPVPGCMDSISITYNPLATIDDGSCTYPPKPPKPPKPVKEKKPKEEKVEEVKVEKVEVEELASHTPKKEKELKVKVAKEKPVKEKKIKEPKPPAEEKIKKQKVKSQKEEKAAVVEKPKKEKEQKEKEPKPPAEEKSKKQKVKSQKEKKTSVKEEPVKEESIKEKAKSKKVKEPKPPKEEKIKKEKVKEPKPPKVKQPKPEEIKSISINDIKKGVMVPIVTTEERTNLADLKKGIMVYDSDIQGYVYYDGKGWKMVGSSVDKSQKRLFRKIPIIGLWSRKKENVE